MSKCVLQMEGGLGKHVALTALVKPLKEKYDEVMVLSSYPGVFEYNPDVKRSLSYDQSFAFEDYFKNADEHFYACGYRESDFRNKKISLIEAACKSIHLEYKESYRPRIYLSDYEQRFAQASKIEMGSYIIIQTSGGRNQDSDFKQRNIMAKDFNREDATELVTMIKQVYPDLSIVNYAFPNEAPIKGTIQFSGLSYRQWIALLNSAETFVSIDSSLQHMSAALENQKQGIVLWGATSPQTFGWKHNINVEGECKLHCQRPYFVPCADLTSEKMLWECQHKNCMKHNLENIVDQITNILKGKNLLLPTVDMSSLIAS